jgi:hypothetical protein
LRQDFVCVTISFFFNTCFLAKKKEKSAMKEEARERERARERKETQQKKIS